MAPLRILLIEDSEDDAVLIGHVLRQAGHRFRLQRVDDLEELEAALRDQRWDVIIADYNLPGFSGMDALEIANARAPDVPFIVVSGAIGEEMAAALMRAGARDFVGKSNLARLAPAIQRELREAAQHQSARSAMDEARELDRMKTLFIHTISHELRNPLTSVAGYLELLERGRVGPLAPAQHEFVEHALHGTRRLQHLIDDLLDYARLDGGVFQLHFQRTDVARVLRETVADLRPQIEEAGVHLVITGADTPTPADVDARRIAQVLGNLLTNAIKFSPRGGTVQVAVQSGPERVRIEVADQGPGIAAADRSKLFHLFTQLEGGVRKGGTGLGLAIAKRIVDAHGGDIGLCEPTAAGATTFFVTLPRDRATASAASAAPPATL